MKLCGRPPGAGLYLRPQPGEPRLRQRLWRLPARLGFLLAVLDQPATAAARLSRRQHQCGRLSAASVVELPWKRFLNPQDADMTEQPAARARICDIKRSGRPLPSLPPWFTSFVLEGAEISAESPKELRQRAPNAQRRAVFGRCQF